MTEPKPTLPFSGYKWKWASLQPTEGLNRPEYFVGVLRALADNEGRRKSDPQFNEDLARIQAEIDIDRGPVLARGNDRNIIRNAGQYWKVLGVLGPERLITLTPLGHLYASRDISLQEFAVHTVLNFRLPSSVYPAEETAAWQAAGISFRPLLLILQIVSALSSAGYSEASISEMELADIVQPLSAVTTDASRIARAIADHRSGELDISSWPRTLSRDSNDYRISAEFLLFLASHNLLREVDSSRSDKKFELGHAVPDDILELADIDPARLMGSTGIESVATDVSVRVERRRVLREVYDRPGQKKFRDDVLEISQTRCFLTGTELTAVLQAAHIRPVSSEGSDLVGNGLCLRSDVHTLFDANKIRIRPDGQMSYSGEVLGDAAYRDLPRNVVLPNHVSEAEVHWRWNFV